jgi:transposase InsO family protein
MRKDHPKWGAKRIRAELIRAGTGPPAVSTIHRVLVRNNLVAPQPRKGPKALKRFTREVPNDLWQIDATRVKLASGGFCWVIDILDDHARYLLAATAAHAESTELACAAFEEASERYGLPRQVLSDNGLSFSGRLHGGKLVGFERRLRAAGVQLINSRPYHPQTLGKIERFHATMKAWLAEHGPPISLEELKVMLERFREHYNQERPHQSLGEAVTPAERYVSGAESPVPPSEEEPAYPAGAVLRMVGANGSLTYDYAKFSVGVVWAHRRLQVVDRQQHIDFFHGERLVRTVARQPGRTYYPLLDRRFPGRRPRR